MGHNAGKAAYCAAAGVAILLLLELAQVVTAQGPFCPPPLDFEFDAYDQINYVGTLAVDCLLPTPTTFAVFDPGFAILSYQWYSHSCYGTLCNSTSGMVEYLPPGPPVLVADDSANAPTRLIISCIKYVKTCSC